MKEPEPPFQAERIEEALALADSWSAAKTSANGPVMPDDLIVLAAALREAQAEIKRLRGIVREARRRYGHPIFEAVPPPADEANDVATDENEVPG